MMATYSKQVHQTSLKMTPFEHQKCLDLLESVAREIAPHVRPRTVFRFVGDPIPPTGHHRRSVDTKTTATTSPSPSTSTSISKSTDDTPTTLHNVKKTYSDTTHPSSHVYVESATGSIVVCNGTRIRSVHIAEARDSVLVIAACDSVFLRKVEKCTVVVSCHQLRCLLVDDCVLYVKVGNNTMTIEKCNHLRIASVPDLDPVTVDDFDAPLRKKKNPHFQYIEYGPALEVQKWAEDAVEDGPLSGEQQEKVCGFYQCR